MRVDSPLSICSPLLNSAEVVETCRFREFWTLGTEKVINGASAPRWLSFKCQSGTFLLFKRNRTSKTGTSGPGHAYQ
jgi:hypothetical protein